MFITPIYNYSLRLCYSHKFTFLQVLITYYCFIFQKKILDFKKGDEKKVAEAEA